MPEISGTRRLRLLMIGRCFWPLGTLDGGAHLMSLASGLHEHGFHVEVLTPKYSSDWAETLTFREITVHRPFRPPPAGWKNAFDRGTSKYLEALSNWLRTYGAGFDVIYCDLAREEAIAASNLSKQLGLPCIVRVAGQGDASDLEWMAAGKFGKRTLAAVQRADAVVLGSAAAERRWRTLGGDASAVTRIAPGSFPQPMHDKTKLRSALARINGDFFVPSERSVLLSIDRHDLQSGIMHLVKAALGLSNEIGSLQYWLVGDGPGRDAVYSRLRGDGLRQSVAMPGSFGVVEDVFQAADLMVHSGSDGFDALIPAAIEASLPMVVSNTAAAREFFQLRTAEVESMILDRKSDQPVRSPTQSDVEDRLLEASCVSWYDTERPRTLRFAVLQMMNQLEAARDRAETLKRRWRREHSGAAMIDAYRRLLRSLAATQHRSQVAFDSEQAS
ncbi:MAG: glycosyltransferase [Planctomycetota bacterium]